MNNVQNDIEKALEFINMRIREDKQTIAFMNGIINGMLDSYLESWKSLITLLNELQRYRKKAPILMLDLSELPDGYTVDSVLSLYKEKGVLVLDSIANNKQTLNTKFFYPSFNE